MRTRLAFLLSFAIHLLPMVGPHTFRFVGEFLVRASEAGSHRYVVAIGGVQAAVFLFLRAVLHRPRARYLGVLALPASWFALAWLLMVVVPVSLLVEDERAPEHLGLRERCVADGYWLTGHGPGAHPLVTTASDFALVEDSTQRPSVLRNDCSVASIDVPGVWGAPGTTAVQPLDRTRAGRLLYAAYERANLTGYYVLEPGANEAVAIELPQPGNGSSIAPSFSPDARFAAWASYIGNGRLRVQGGEIGEPWDVDFDPAAAERGSYSVIDVAEGGDAILLENDPARYRLVHANGDVIWTLTAGPGIRPTHRAIRVAPDGQSHLVWEILASGERCAIAWTIDDNAVRREIPKGACITNAAISHDWRWIAASTTTALSIGGIDDWVIVWSANGEEVYRKRLRRYNRAPVVFLDGGVFGYSEIDAQGRGSTHLLELPDAGAAPRK